MFIRLNISTGAHTGPSVTDVISYKKKKTFRLLIKCGGFWLAVAAMTQRNPHITVCLFQRVLQRSVGEI